MPTKEFLVIERHLDSTPARAYQAWSDPELIKQWWGPDEGDKNEVVEVDVRVGGKYHIVTDAPNGDRYDFSGEFSEVDPGRKISFTWDTGNEKPGSVVTAEVSPEGDGSSLTLTHQGLATKAERDGCEHGWAGALEKLERVVAYN